MGLTQVQMSIIDFLYRNQSDRALYQTDVEQEFNIQKSSATTLLQLMEKKGLIHRVPSKTDSRYKVIQLTKKAQQSAKRGRTFYDATEQQLRTILGAQSDQFIQNLEILTREMKAKLTDTKSVGR